NVPSVNIGNMKNRGVDLQINYKGNTNNQDFAYSISLNISHYKNEILKLSDQNDEAILGTAYRDHIYSRGEIGTSFPAFFGYQVEGIIQTEEEAGLLPPAFNDYNSPG